MSKAKFRLLLLVTIVLVVLAGTSDNLWQNSVQKQVFEYAYNLESAVEVGESLVLVTLAFLAILFSITSIIGLMLFKNWARHLYLATLILSATSYPFQGVSIFSGLSQLFYDTSILLFGVILCLIYYSPVADYFQDENSTSQVNGTPKSSAPS
ncbi:MAG: hypothetical protein R3F02_15730 [Thiolinea sp.]